MSEADQREGIDESFEYLKAEKQHEEVPPAEEAILTQLRRMTAPSEMVHALKHFSPGDRREALAGLEEGLRDSTIEAALDQGAIARGNSLAGVGALATGERRLFGFSALPSSGEATSQETALTRTKSRLHQPAVSEAALEKEEEATPKEGEQQASQGAEQLPKTTVRCCAVSNCCRYVWRLLRPSLDTRPHLNLAAPYIAASLLQTL